MITCLSCAREMTRSQCNCGGAWLSEKKLLAKANKIRGELVALKWAKRQGQHRKCPECTHKMKTVMLVDVELDRCAEHGVWFDAFELQTVLERAGNLPKAKVPEVHEVPEVSDHKEKAVSGGGADATGAVEAVFSVLGGLLALLD